jgi:UDP-N-acetylglucosamine--N-acetylmuramyl-(pentapeptide) pyrophosphoryl-undecaprenol N-acetylglucosamine transferase
LATPTPPIPIFFAGGGTGGHLYPGISVAQALVRLNPAIKPVFLTTKRAIDETILKPTGYTFIPQPIVPLVRNVGGLLKFWKGWRETTDQIRVLLREHKPAAVLGLGGYAAGVAVKLAAKRNKPTAVLNPDVIPGKANLYLMQYVRAVCCQFEQTKAHTPVGFHPKLITTGCPIRDSFLNLPPREQAAERLGLDPRLATFTITGASQGSLTVNDAALGTLAQVKLQGWQILHLAGKDHATAVSAGYREMGISAHVIDFTPAMEDVWSVTDLTLSRAGGSTCAELTALGIPSILMPYPYHKDKHQRYNGQVLQEAGGAIVMDDAMDKQKNTERLKPLLEPLLYDVTKRQAMATAVKKLGHPDAAEKVARVMLEMIQ